MSLTGAWLGRCGVGQAWHKCFVAWHGLHFWARLKWMQGHFKLGKPHFIAKRKQNKFGAASSGLFDCLCVFRSQRCLYVRSLGSSAAHSIAKCAAKKRHSIENEKTNKKTNLNPTINEYNGQKTQQRLWRKNITKMFMLFHIIYLGDFLYLFVRSSMDTSFGPAWNECSGATSSWKARISDICSQDVRQVVFGRFDWQFRFYIMNETHQKYSLLDTIFSYTLYLDLQENIYTIYNKMKTIHYMSADFAGRHVLVWGT